MSGKYGILSFVLLFIIFLLFIKNYEIWTTPIKKEALKKEVVKKLEKKPEAISMAVDQKNPAPIQSTISISEKNIFNPERKEFILFASDAKKPVARPQIVLYGVTIAGDCQFASVVHSGKPLKKGERELMTLKIGDQVGGYKLAKILSDRITLEAEGDTFEVLLYDPRMPKRRIDVKTERKPVAVTTSLPTTASPSAGPSKPPQESVQRPKETVPERVATPPPMPRPASPSLPPPPTRRGRGPYYPPSGSPTLPGAPIPPGTPPQGTGE